MAEDESDRVRGRMDRSLDEIAAEMHPFGRDYEERGLSVDTHRSHRSSHRYSPYPSDRGGASWRSSSPRRFEDGTRIFAANLDYTVTWQKLKDHMRKAGPVSKCDIFKNADGSSRGMGLVVYADSESAKRALRELNNSDLEGRRLFLREDMKHDERERVGMATPLGGGRSRPPPNPANTVFVANLAYSVTWQKLKDIFKVAGRIVNAEIQMDREGRSKGCGIVQFETPVDALNSIGFHVDGLASIIEKSRNEKYIRGFDIISSLSLCKALFHGQMLHDRPMTVRMDSKSPFRPDPMQLKLSSGLGGLGGIGGKGGAGLPGLGSSSFSGSSNNPLLAGLPLLAALGLSSLTPEQLSLLNSSSFAASLNKGGSSSGSSRDFMPSRSHGLGSLPELRLHSDPLPLPSSGAGYSKRERERSPDLYPREPRMKPSNYSPNRDYYIPPPRPSSGYGPDVPPYRMSESFPSSGRKLFVKNLHYNTSWQRLKDTFRRVGSIAHVDILKGSDGRSRGCAVVTFDHPDDAQKAIDVFNNSELDGRRIEVRFDKLS